MEASDNYSLELPKLGEWTLIARYMIRLIMYDNGAINRNQPDDESRYPENHVINIAFCCAGFFRYNPDMYTEEIINTLCIGDEDDVEKLFFDKTNFKYLHQSLNNYFNGSN